MTARGLVGMDDMAARLRGVVAALEGFQSAPDGEGHQERLLELLAGAAVKAVPGASAASVTVLQDGELPAWTAAATHRIAIAVDLEQYTSGQGPCLEAARERHPVRGKVEDGRERWPSLMESAARIGVRSFLSVPLLLDDKPVLGSLNLYGMGTGGFDVLDEALVTLVNSVAAAALVNLGRYSRARRRAEELNVALTSRAEIDQAKGVLMARHGIPAGQAFTMLVGLSQRSNTKLRDVARELLESVSAPATPE